MFWNKSSEVLGSFSFLPLWGSRHRLCQSTSTSTHFWSSTQHYIAQGNKAKDRFEITAWIQHSPHDLKPSVDNNKQFSVTKSITKLSSSPRGWSCKQIFHSSTTFLKPLVRTNSLYGKRTVGFFSLASHAHRVCETLKLCLTDFKKKTDCFAVY